MRGRCASPEQHADRRQVAVKAAQWTRGHHQIGVIDSEAAFQERLQHCAVDAGHAAELEVSTPSPGRARPAAKQGRSLPYGTRLDIMCMSAHRDELAARPAEMRRVGKDEMACRVGVSGRRDAGRD